jgi:hypothetical protein
MFVNPPSPAACRQTAPSWPCSGQIPRLLSAIPYVLPMAKRIWTEDMAINTNSSYESGYLVLVLYFLSEVHHFLWITFKSFPQYRYQQWYLSEDFMIQQFRECFSQ